MKKIEGSAGGVFDEISHPNRGPGKRKAVLLGISVITATIFGAGYWASTAPLSSAVIAEGQIVVSGKRKQVQHREGGTVRTINVRDGAFVKAGDILIELEDSEAYLKYKLAKTAFYSSLATKYRLMAERDKRDKITFPELLITVAHKDESIANLLQTQRDMFSARRTEQEGQIVVLRQRIAQIKEEIRGHEAEQAATREQSRIAKTELDLLNELLKEGYTTRTRVSALQRESAQLVGNTGKLAASVARAKANIGEAKLQILQINKQFRAEVLKELKEVEDRIYDLREKAETASQTVERLRIRAPTAGEIVNMQISTVGGVIQPGETVLEIVPKTDRLIIEARVRPVDVDQVSVGLDTEVRITAFKQRTTPTFDGEVILLSADALQDERTGESYFVAQIKVIANSKTLAAVRRLQPGMPAEVMIKTGQRTALAYLVQPIMESLNRAMRER